MRPWLRYLIVAIIFGHGFIYVNFSLGRLPDALKDWRGTSWLLRGTVSGHRLKVLAFALHAAAGIAIIAASIGIALVPVFPRLWRPLAIVGSTIAILAFASFWDGQTQRLVQQGVIGTVLSLILLLSAIALP